jgi:hypothetical protein
MAKIHEISVATLIARETELNFSGRNFDLGEWGKVDDYVLLKPNCYLFLEVEAGQKHPCTNVLKVWPYLEANPQISVVLAQTFFPHSPGRSNARGKLGRWLGQRLEMTLRDRFWYHRLIIAADSSGILEGLEELLQSLDDFNRVRRANIAPPRNQTEPLSRGRCETANE